MAGISSKAVGKLENHKKFVGQEFDEDLGVNLYQFKWRNHDPQIGRFSEIDPLADEYEYNSTYAYAENRPIDGIDLEGLEWMPINKDNQSVPVNDKENINGYKWVGYNVNDKGDKTPKANTVATAYTFGEKGMTTLSSENFEQHTTWQAYEDVSTGDKTADKNIATLDPKVQNDMKKLVLIGRLRFDIDVRGAGQGGFRTYGEQNDLYAKGRTAPGKVVTHARGGQSNHNFGLAMDIAIYENGTYLNKGSEWQYSLMGRVGKTQIGLEWGGDWKGKKFDPAHHQNMQGYSLDELRALPKDANGYIIIK
jgi:RHS repeat-associated protein